MGYLFNEALTSIVKNEIDYLNDDIKVALYIDAPDIDADTYLSDLGTESSGSGYIAGGATLASKTVTTDDANNRTIADAADVQWTDVSVTYRYIVVYQATDNASTSRLIAAHDTGSLQNVDNGTVDVTWPASGVFFIQNP